MGLRVNNPEEMTPKLFENKESTAPTLSFPETHIIVLSEEKNPMPLWRLPHNNVHRELSAP